MTDKNEPDLNIDRIPDRPLECGECKKPISIRYTEIVGDTISHTSMCADCPQLQKRLHGLTSSQRTDIPGEGGLIACGECGTTLEALKMGNPVGCSACYEVFGENILSELIALDKLPQRIISSKKTTPIHIGRAPGETQEMNPSMRLLALNEALRETLKREDYEQAAWLRDQIKALTEENGEKKEDGQDERAGL